MLNRRQRQMCIRDRYWIPAGLFDADPGLALSTHIHVRSKAHWEVLDELTPRREEGFDP